MGVNKVIVGDEVKLDLTADTVSEDNLLAGATAHNAVGEPITGTVVTVPVDSDLSEVSENAVQNKVVSKAIKGVETLSGSTGYTVNDSVEYPIIGLKVFGRSTQDRTPTPDNPVEIVSIVEPMITVCGKNLISEWRQGLLSTSDGVSTDSNSYWVYTEKYINVDTNNEYILSSDTTCKASIYEYDANKTYIRYLQPLCYNTSSKYIPSQTCHYIRFGYNYSGVSEIIKPNDMGVKHWLQIEKCSTVTAYEPYTAKILSIPYTLRGIPASRGGNMVINGEGYIADFNDYTRGIKIECVAEINARNLTWYKDEGWSGADYSTFSANVINKYIVDVATVRSNRYISKSRRQYNSSLRNAIIATSNGNCIEIVGVSQLTLEEWNEFITNNDVIIQYALKQPVEIPLSEAEMQAYRQLQTYNGTTNISNDKGAGVEVKYCTSKALSECVSPITKNMQKQIDDLKSAVLSLGGNV